MGGVVLFELNEVPPKIVDHYVEQRPDSHFADLVRSARVYESVTEDSGELHPWITWPTLHRGITNDRHTIKEFGQDLEEIDNAFPPVWKLLEQAGVSTGVFGSLHSYPLPAERRNFSFYVPDIFAAGPECFPEAITPFQNFCLGMARESGRNVSSRLPLADAASLLKSLPELGITPRTVADLAGQILGERVESARVVRRRTYQSVLAFDVFMRQMKLRAPKFATFFTNHVASSMHRYWAALFPDDYANHPYDVDWRRTYGGEIMFAMDKADQMIGRLLKFARNTGRELIVATSMGQDAVEAVPIDTQLYVTKPERFLATLGLAAEEWEIRPTMLPSFNFQTTKADYAEARLKSLCVNGKPITFQTDGLGFFSVNFGHINLGPNPHIAVGNETVPFSDSGLENVTIQDRSATVADHVPGGTLIIFDGRSKNRLRTQVTTRDIAPYLLNKFGVRVPDYMVRGATI